MQCMEKIFTISMLLLSADLFGLKNFLLLKKLDCNIFNSYVVCARLNKSTEKKELPHFKVDCVFSLGKHCRPAHHIDKHGMRFQAAPFDWMMSYSLDEVLKQIESKFKHFFDNIEEVPDDRKNPEHKIVKDKDGNTISMHHFPLDKDIKDYKKEFSSIMQKRFKKVDSIIKKSDSVAFICERNISFDELFDFAKKFSKIYEKDGKKKKIVIFNIVDSDFGLEKFKYEMQSCENIDIVQFYFCDKSENWKGNYKHWNTVMSFIKLTDKGENLKKDASKNKNKKLV